MRQQQHDISWSWPSNKESNPWRGAETLRSRWTAGNVAALAGPRQSPASGPKMADDFQPKSKSKGAKSLDGGRLQDPGLMKRAHLSSINASSSCPASSLRRTRRSQSQPCCQFAETCLGHQALLNTTSLKKATRRTRPRHQTQAATCLTTVSVVSLPLDAGRNAMH